MQHIQGISRNQLQVSSLEDTIIADNPAGFIEAFVCSIDLVKLGFMLRVLKTNNTSAKNAVTTKESKRFTANSF